MFSVDDQIVINDPEANYHGQTGTIIAVKSHDSFPYRVQMDDGMFWFTAEEVTGSTDEPQAIVDFDRGFGIGALGRHTEEPIVPTLNQIKRLEQMEQRAQRCKQCGCSDVFDGAMFTTDPASGFCDDCYQ